MLWIRAAMKGKSDEGSQLKARLTNRLNLIQLLFVTRQYSVTTCNMLQVTIDQSPKGLTTLIIEIRTRVRTFKVQVINRVLIPRACGKSFRMNKRYPDPLFHKVVAYCAEPRAKESESQSWIPALKAMYKLKALLTKAVNLKYCYKGCKRGLDSC